ncbi:ribonuclease P protein component [Patescibacteria group bacterium]|nr:ribonuclease P protein component [Patescibacteria group bacterium]
MYRASLRLPRATFSSRPSRRTRTQYGSVSFFDQAPPGYAVIISKKTLRRAVDRNRLRRRVRHIVRGLADPRCGVVVYPTGEALRAPYAVVRDSLGKAVLLG